MQVILKPQNGAKTMLDYNAFAKMMIRSLREHLEKDEAEISYRKKILAQWEKEFKNQGGINGK